MAAALASAPGAAAVVIDNDVAGPSAIRRVPPVSATHVSLYPLVSISYPVDGDRSGEADPPGTYSRRVWSSKASHDDHTPGPAVVRQRPSYLVLACGVNPNRM